MNTRFICRPNHPDNGQSLQGGFIKYALLAVGAVIAVLLGVIVVILLVGRTGVPGDGSGISASQKAQMKAAIERVLKQDTTTSTGARTVAEVVTRMRAISLVGCPEEFSRAYVTHIHAWEVMAGVERDAIAWKKDNEPAAVFVEAFIRGLLLDPLGKYNDLKAAENQLTQNARAAGQQVQDTFNRVEEIAVALGASLPQK
jgi:hypothetical protein